MTIGMPDQLQVKRESESEILAVGGKICDWLPFIAPDELSLRDTYAVAQRALVLSTLVNVSFGAPLQTAKDWLEEHDLLGTLSVRESAILSEVNAPDETSRNKLRWNIESLWAIAWVGCLFDGLTPLQSISDQLAVQLPNLPANESSAEFYRRFRMRTKDEIYRKLDLFFRSHWYTRDCHINGTSSTPFNPGIVHFHRLPLEWVCNSHMDWDNVDLST